MCYFVFIGFPSEHVPEITRRLSGVGLSTGVVSNPSVRGAFSAADAVLAITHQGCSCDLYGAQPTRFDEASVRRSYERKGWSKAKIDRAVAGRRPTERPIFGAFRRCIAELARDLGPIRLLAHDFSGSVDSEPVAARGRERRTLEEFERDGGSYPADVVLELSATPPDGG